MDFGLCLLRIVAVLHRKVLVMTNLFVSTVWQQLGFSLSRGSPTSCLLCVVKCTNLTWGPSTVRRSFVQIWFDSVSFCGKGLPAGSPNKAWSKQGTTSVASCPCMNFVPCSVNMWDLNMNRWTCWGRGKLCMFCTAPDFKADWKYLCVISCGCKSGPSVLYESVLRRSCTLHSTMIIAFHLDAKATWK